MGAALGSSFFKQAGLALLLSFLFMGIVVIIYFRIWIPSLAVIVCAFSDIIVTMSIFNLTGMKLSTAGVAAFLMLIGYSIDTDILLTSRVLHRKEGTVMDRIYSSISTGMTMTITTIAVVTVALIFVQSETIRQIMLIILIGMFVDMIMTWIQNVAILRLYLEHKEKK
jgi:preprotein translocase subunit SecF